MTDRFNTLWNQYVKPLKGQKIYTMADSKENAIIDATDDYLIRLSFEGNNNLKSSKLLFKEIYNHLLKKKIITPVQINNDYHGRRS